MDTLNQLEAAGTAPKLILGGGNSKTPGKLCCIEVTCFFKIIKQLLVLLPKLQKDSQMKQA